MSDHVTLDRGYIRQCANAVNYTEYRDTKTQLHHSGKKSQCEQLRQQQGVRPRDQAGVREHQGERAQADAGAPVREQVRGGVQQPRHPRRLGRVVHADDAPVRPADQEAAGQAGVPHAAGAPDKLVKHLLHGDIVRRPITEGRVIHQ